MSKLLRAWTWIPWYCSILFTWIKVWGLNERVKKRRITFNPWDWDNSLRPSVNLPGALGLAINMRPNYPHLTSLDYVETLSLWWINSYSERSYQVRLDATTVVWDTDQGSSPFRSLRSGVVGWIGTLLSLSPRSYLSIIPLSYAYFRI